MQQITSQRRFADWASEARPGLDVLYAYEHQRNPATEEEARKWSDAGRVMLYRKRLNVAEANLDGQEVGRIALCARTISPAAAKFIDATSASIVVARDHERRGSPWAAENARADFAGVGMAEGCRHVQPDRSSGGVDPVERW